MTKSKRILLFSVGIIVGSVMVYFTLIKDRDRTYWLPENRVKNNILNSKIIYSPHAKCMMACREIDEASILNVLKNGDVNFSESNIRDTPCPSYAIDGTITGNKKIRIVVTTIDSISEIETAIDLNEKKDTCLCK